MYDRHRSKSRMEGFFEDEGGWVDKVRGFNVILLYHPPVLYFVGWSSIVFDVVAAASGGQRYLYPQDNFAQTMRPLQRDLSPDIQGDLLISVIEN